MTSRLLETALVERVLDRALENGGDFAELYSEQSDSTTIALKDGRVERPARGYSSGGAVRVVLGEATFFGYVDGLHERGLLDLAASVAGAVRGRRDRATVCAGSRVNAAPTQSVLVPPSAVGVDRKVAVLRECDERARSASAHVQQVAGGYAEAHRVVDVANSLGLRTVDERVRVRVAAEVVARRDDVVRTGRDVIAGHGGFEILGDDPARCAGMAAEKAVRLLDAVPAPVGEHPIVLGNGFGGVLFHEATGHGLEADAVGKKASVFAEMSGSVVASAMVTAFDDGLLPGAWGTNGSDDEGELCRRTCVIEEGTLMSYLSDAVTIRSQGIPPTGNGRRESYRHRPIPRMTNTYIAPGGSSPDELIASVDHGLYALSFAGGQVDPATGDFVFGVSEGYLIEAGRVTSPIADATLVGNGLDVLKRVRGVADDLDVVAGTCGKDGQWVPVGVGQPTLLIERMTVGGSA